MTRLAFVIGYGAASLPMLLEVLDEESREHGFEYVAVRDVMASRHVDFIRGADAVLIYSGGLPEEVEEAVRNGGARLVIPLSDSCRHLMKVDPQTLSRAVAYYKTGGRANLRNLIHLILGKLGFSVEVGGLEEIPWHGILHPENGLFDSTEKYLEAYPHASRPLVGVLFYRSCAVYERLDHVRAVIEALEAEGLGVIPVFTYGFRDPVLDTPTAEDSIRRYFFVGGRPVVEAVVDLTSFFLLDHGRWSRDGSRRFQAVSGVSLLKRLGVPVISAVASLSQSVDDWLKDERGVDYLSQVYRVIMPEVDGLIEPVFVAGSKMDLNGVKSYEPYMPHARYLARRVKNWTRLRRKPPSRRRIAFILINPPCKNLEANIAVGFGLDVPESIVRLLRRLKEYGYNVGDSLPENGDELVRMFLDRKAFSEFRWTSVEDIVRSGGAVGFVDADTYMKWFNELPGDVREKMISDWGHPLDVLQGRCPKELVGMVYDGKFVVPGIVLGNILVTTQPKFGCAGPACDGRVCRILHDPSITPPHQWLAVYRWITRVFKADVIIHFGTHGALEFRPGKGVGLSPSCWPEISVDEVPHLYVYVVSNPMEGVIAKRRSYAAIVDHMYPPMRMADVLDEVNLLLAQYFHARQLGDYVRAEIIYDELVEKARRHRIPVKNGDPDRVVREIHRYVNDVRSTQIEAGLHVFGNPPGDRARIAEHVAAAMAYDSHELPSIRRVLAECLGLSYDELRTRPDIVNRLGLTNSETLDLLHKLAVRIIARLLEKEVAPGELNPQLLVDILSEETSRLMGGVGYSKN